MYVILHPHSQTNPSSEHRVVNAADWAAYVNGARKSIAFYGQFNDYDSALARRDELNEEEEKSDG